MSRNIEEKIILTILPLKNSIFENTNKKLFFFSQMNESA
jgi:hypothetical protein